MAAATSSQINIKLDLADISTKDSESEFAEFEPVGHSWSGQVDALVTDGKYEEDKVVCDTEIELGGGGGTYYKATKTFTLKPGYTIQATGDDIIILLNGTTPLTEPGTGAANYTNEGNSDITVTIASDTEDSEVNVWFTDGLRTPCAALVTAARNGTPVTVKFSLTTGRNNAVEDTNLLSGTAIITDLTLTAANKEVSTFSAQFTGKGELSEPEEEE
ncbi:MAG: hypothetical protein IKY91_08380 [Akkermansia sp.]|nr:hypothetical protein [Akkermansia sp.]